jgi:hypothetical protein
MTVQTKFGDTLILSGVLGESNPIPDADWVGASAVINIVKYPSLVPVIARAAITLTVVGSVKTYRYVGTGLPLGTYSYEIEVTYGDTTVRTFPNNTEVMKLQVVKDLG